MKRYLPLAIWLPSALAAALWQPQYGTLAALLTLPLVLFVLFQPHSAPPVAVHKPSSQPSDDALLLREEKRLLELVAQHRPLHELMETLCRMTERRVPGVRCSVMLLDEAGTRLHVLAAPSLPADYSAAVDGIAIGPCVGSCGSAAWRNETVIVDDVLRHPFWEGFRALILGYPMRACWAVPIRGRQGEALGTFALYYDEVRRPDERDLDMVLRCGELASSAIQHHRITATLQRHADEDGLTGLYNRRRLEAGLERGFAAARTSGQPLSLLVADLDHFKRVNDAHGHAAGDEVLRQFGRLCLRLVRDSDIVGRAGGEEFVVVLPGADAHAARQAAERLRQETARLAIVYGGQRIQISVSVGTATLDGDDADARALMARADRAMYEAKQAGRNRVRSCPRSLLPCG